MGLERDLVRRRPLIELRTVPGTPVEAYGMVVTPLSQALVIRLPFGGGVWHRPVAVLVEHDGITTRLGVPDITRRVQLALAACSFILLLVVRMKAAAKKETKHG